MQILPVTTASEVQILPVTSELPLNTQESTGDAQKTGAVAFGNDSSADPLPQKKDSSDFNKIGLSVGLSQKSTEEPQKSEESPQKSEEEPQPLEVSFQDVWDKSKRLNDFNEWFYEYVFTKNWIGYLPFSITDRIVDILNYNYDQSFFDFFVSYHEHVVYFYDGVTATKIFPSIENLIEEIILLIEQIELGFLTVKKPIYYIRQSLINMANGAGKLESTCKRLYNERADELAAKKVLLPTPKNNNETDVVNFFYRTKAERDVRLLNPWLADEEFEKFKKEKETLYSDILEEKMIEQLNFEAEILRKENQMKEYRKSM